MNAEKTHSDSLIDGVELLQQELTRRISANPRYSLRAFARTLHMSPATLSLVLSRKIGLSKRTIEKMAEALTLEPTQLAALREKRKAKTSGRHVNSQASNITMEVFTVLSEWYHFAILS